MKHYISHILLIFILFSGCYKEPDFTNFDYKTYNRIVGPHGGVIRYFANYKDDDRPYLNVEMDFPKGALDSMMVFNMYQFEEYELVVQMEEGFAQIGSRFLYFVPFYESEGYYKRSQLDLSYHLSSEFNTPVNVKFYYLADKDSLSLDNWQETELYHDYYKNTDELYKLFRIKIPKIDEWGEDNNIYVNWNKQGYPDGYDRTDLSYIINGSWSSINKWGSDVVNLENWETVENYTLNDEGFFPYVEFEIQNTDYMYVLARIIYVKPENVPLKIKNSLSTRYPSLEVTRASFNGTIFTLYLSDNSYASFQRNGTFIERVLDNFNKSNLPTTISDYINDNYNSQFIKKVTLTQRSEIDQTYRILLDSGIILYFDKNGTFLGRYEYGLGYDQLPSTSKDYLIQNHPNEFVTNVTLDNGVGGTSSYITYLNTNTKVYFDLNGNWSYTSKRLKEDQLPPKIEQFFEDNHPNPKYISIIYSYEPDDSGYEIELIDESSYEFDKDGELVEMEVDDMKKEMLPLPISSLINLLFPDLEISNIDYYYNDYGQDAGFEIEFTDMLYLNIDNTGNFKEYYGANYNHLLPKMKDFLNEFYPDKRDVVYCGFVLGKGYEIEFSDKMYILLDSEGNLVELYGEDISHLPPVMKTFVTNNYPGTNVISCSYSQAGETEYLVENDAVYYNWEAHLEGGLWLVFDNNQGFMFIYDEEILANEFILPIAQYLQTNHPGVGISCAYRYFSDFYSKIIYYITLDDSTDLVFDINGVFQAQYKKSSSTKLKKKSSMIKIDRDKLRIKDKWSLKFK